VSELIFLVRFRFFVVRGDPVLRRCIGTDASNPPLVKLWDKKSSRTTGRVASRLRGASRRSAIGVALAVLTMQHETAVTAVQPAPATVLGGLPGPLARHRGVNCVVCIFGSSGQLGSPHRARTESPPRNGGGTPGRVGHQFPRFFRGSRWANQHASVLYGLLRTGADESPAPWAGRRCRCPPARRACPPPLHGWRASD